MPAYHRACGTVKNRCSSLPISGQCEKSGHVRKTARGSARNVNCDAKQGFANRAEGEKFQPDRCSPERAVPPFEIRFFLY
jgi:hypothetical protein